MINNERIVPIQKIDRLSAIGETLSLAQRDYTILKATDVEGNFSISLPAPGVLYLANQPVKTLDFATDVPNAEVYFIPDYNFAGFTKNGVAISPTVHDVQTILPDGVSLYKAEYNGSALDIYPVTPQVNT